MPAARSKAKPADEPKTDEPTTDKPGPEPTASESSGTGDQAGGAVERREAVVPIGENGEGWTTLDYPPADVTLLGQPESGTASLEPVPDQPEQTCVKVVNATAGSTAVVPIEVAGDEPAPDEPEAEEPEAEEPTLDEIGAKLIADKQGSDPIQQIGGAELAGAQLSDNATDNMIAGDRAEPAE